MIRCENKSKTSLFLKVSIVFFNMFLKLSEVTNSAKNSHLSFHYLTFPNLSYPNYSPSNLFLSTPDQTFLTNFLLLLLIDLNTLKHGIKE